MYNEELTKVTRCIIVPFLTFEGKSICIYIRYTSCNSSCLVSKPFTHSLIRHVQRVRAQHPVYKSKFFSGRRTQGLKMPVRFLVTLYGITSPYHRQETVLTFVNTNILTYKDLELIKLSLYTTGFFYSINISDIYGDQ